MFSWFKKTPPTPTNYSFDGLKSVHMQLVRHRELSESALVELLRVSSEFLIYSDQHTAQQSFFEYFCEKNMLALFVQIGEASPPHRVQVQLLQTLSLLVQNITTTTSLYYILSNNYINRLMTCRHFQLDQEDVRDWYVTFLKALSIRLNVDTVQFFFNSATRTFPLYIEALKFRDCNEIQVQIAVKTVLLNVLRVPDDRMRRFLTHRQNMPYFVELVDQGQVLALKMQGILNTTSLSASAEDKLHYVLDATIDHWYYLQDILDVPMPDLCFQVGEWIFEAYLKTFVAQSLLPNCGGGGGQRVSTLLALFLLLQFFQCVAHSPVLNAATFMLFHPEAGVNCNYMAAALGTGSRRLSLRRHPHPPSTEPPSSVTSPRFVLPLQKLPKVSFEPHATPSCSSSCYLLTRYASGEWPGEELDRVLNRGNLFRSALLALVDSSDIHLSLAAADVLHAVASNKNVDRSLLKDCQLVPSVHQDADASSSSDDEESPSAYNVQCVDMVLRNLQRAASLTYVSVMLRLLMELTGSSRMPQGRLLSGDHQKQLLALRTDMAAALLEAPLNLALWDRLLARAPQQPAAVDWSAISPFAPSTTPTADAEEKYLALHHTLVVMELLPPLRPQAVLEHQQHETAELDSAFLHQSTVGLAETSFLPCAQVTRPDECLFCLLNVDKFVLVRPERDMTRGSVQILTPLYATIAELDDRVKDVVHVQASGRVVDLLFQSPEMAQQALLHVTGMKRSQIERKSKAIAALLA